MQRFILALTAIAGMVVVTAVAWQRDAGPVASWPGRSAAGAAPLAVLIELGVKDASVRDWSGRAIFKGARLLKREGYRFRAGDRLLPPNAWKASSHRAIRVPKGSPAISKMEPIVSVGIVHHVDKIEPQAKLIIEPANEKLGRTEVALVDISAGQVKELWNGAARVRLLTTATSVADGKTEDDFPAAAYHPDGSLWIAHVSYTVKEDDRRIEPPMLTEAPADFKKFYTPEPGDQLFVRHLRNGAWGPAIPVTPPGQDLARCAIGVTAGKQLVVAYSARRNGNFDLFFRTATWREADDDQEPALIWSREECLTSNPGQDINPVMCNDRDGNLWLACQSWIDGQGCISVFAYKQGKWATRALLKGKAGENCWHPAIAADDSGKVAVAFDVYRDGDYDIKVAIFDEANSKRLLRDVAATDRAEMRPSVAFQGRRLFIAFEEGPPRWGKDYGAQSVHAGNPLYNERSVRVVCLNVDGTRLKPAAELPTSTYDPPRLPFDPSKTHKYETTTRYAYPRLGTDMKGRLWLACRQNFGSRYSSHPGSYWLTFVRRLDGDHWTEPIEVHHSDGLLDHRPALLPHPAGGVAVVHNTDGRYTTPEVIDNQIYHSVIDLPGGGAPPRLVADAIKPKTIHDDVVRESRAVRAIRGYRIDHAGKSYRILRGEYHRHTEISWDGGADGSLEDMFRYAIDAADMDWIGNGDHDNGAGREYSWWLTQKFTDAFLSPDAFVPMFSYERSVAYPHGHRNVMFAQRGVRTLPRLAPPGGEKSPGGVHADDTKMLYRYLKEHRGICAVHTSATGMGTDWRDNDPAVEPIVEIYQGDRMSYEHEGAPRAGFDPQTGKLPANVAGWYPRGFIDLALKKGYRLGFQASSDHWSTHISYFMVLAERFDRQGILDAIRKRHVYGATDNIIVDVRCGPFIMGDEFKTRVPPRLDIHVVGANDLAKIDILRDSEVIDTLRPEGQGYATAWTDPRPRAGLHYYYVRVVQRDGEIAWGTPLWVHFGNE